MSKSSHGISRSGEDLAICPICFGHTKLLGENVYCPHCAVIISENVADAMKTKVQLIKEQVISKRVAPEIAKQIHLRRISVATTLGFFIVIVLTALPIGLKGVDLARAMAFEKNGNYQQAIVAYEKAQWLVPIPGVNSKIHQAEKLAASADNYEKGQRAFEEKRWQDAIFYYNLVDRNDTNYNRAVLAKDLAQKELKK